MIEFETETGKFLFFCLIFLLIRRYNYKQDMRRYLGFIISLVILFYGLPVLAQAAPHSVDAILVYATESADTSTGNIKYLFRGHTPAIPDNATSTPGHGPISQWNWFSGNPQSPTLNTPGTIGTAAPARGASGGPPFELAAGPKVAFSREGYAVVVYTRFIRSSDDRFCYPGDPGTPKWRSELRWALYSDASSALGIVDQGVIAGSTGLLASELYLAPSVAIDSSGNGLAIWQHVIQDPCSPVTSLETNMHSARWHGASRSWMHLGHIDRSSSATHRGNQLIEYIQPSTAIAFNSVLVPTSTLALSATASTTRQQAVAVWKEFVGVESTICSGTQTFAATFWPSYAIWTGTEWSTSTPALIPDPPDKWKSYLTDGKLDISTDQLGNAVPVWSVARVLDICRGRFADEVWFARHNGTSTSPMTGMWEKTAAIYGSGMSPTIAYEPGDIPLLTSLPDQPATSFFAAGDRTIKRSEYVSRSEFVTGIPWIDQPDTGQNGFNPTNAHLPHFRRLMALQQSQTGLITWFEVAGGSTASGSFEAGSHPDLAARSGSPTVPHAVTTVMHYDAPAPNLAPYVIKKFVRIADKGSTHLVTHIYTRDRLGPITQSHYIKHGDQENPFTVSVRDWGSNLQFNQGETLRDVVAWSKEMYPADNYILELGGHGFGWRGACQDDQDLGLMDLVSLGQGLREGLQDAFDRYAGRFRFSHIIFDACLMATVEVADELQGVADFMLASAEIFSSSAGFGGTGIPWELTPVENVLAFAVNPAALATAIVDSVQLYNQGRGSFKFPPGEFTFSSIKLAQVPALAADINRFAQEIINYVNPGGTGIDVAKRLHVQGELARAIPMRGQPAYRDLFDFATLMSTSSPALPWPETLMSAARDVVSHETSTLTRVWADTEKKDWNNEPGRNFRGLTIWTEHSRPRLLDATSTGVTNSYLSEAYLATAFSRDAPKWHEMLLTIAATPGLKVTLSSPLVPELFVKVTDQVGSSTGEMLDAGLCRWCHSEIPEASCYVRHQATERVQEFFIPNASGTYSWFVDGSLLTSSAPYTLTLQELDDAGFTLQEATSTGSVAPGQTIAGQFTIGPPVPDNDLPTITLLAPADNHQATSTNQISFSYTASDPTSRVRSCQLLLDGAVTQTDTTVTEGATETFTKLLADGAHTWQVACTDSSLEQNVGFSEMRTITVTDLSPPVVTLLQPLQNATIIPTSTITTSVIFSYQVVDSFYEIASCSLLIDEVVKMSQAAVPEGVVQTFSQIVGPGLHTWQVRCTDSSPNVNQGSSAIQTFTVSSRSGGVKQRQLFLKDW